MKCYGSDSSEKPIILNKTVGPKGENRQYAGVLPFSKHPDNFCMPCCFKKMFDMDKV